MTNRTLKGYRARQPDEQPGDFIYLCWSRGPKGKFVSTQPEPPKALPRAEVKQMMKEYEGFKLVKVYTKA